MSPRKEHDPAFLNDIRKSCALLLSRTKHTKFPDFVSDLSLQDGIIHRLVIIGEAAKNLSETTREQYHSIDWKDMIRLRDLAVHHYWSLNLTKIWDTLQNDVPRLLEILS